MKACSAMCSRARTSREKLWRPVQESPHPENSPDPNKKVRIKESWSWQPAGVEAELFEEEGLFNRCLRSTWQDHAVACASLSAKAAPALIVGVGRRASGEGTCRRGGLTVAQSFESEMHDLWRPRSVAAFPCEVRPCRLASTSTTCQSVAKPPSSFLKSGIYYFSHVLEFAWTGQIDFQCGFVANVKDHFSHSYQILPTIRTLVFWNLSPHQLGYCQLEIRIWLFQEGQKRPQKVFQLDDIFFFFLLQITDWNKTALIMNASLEWLFL